VAAHPYEKRVLFQRNNPQATSKVSIADFIADILRVRRAAKGWESSHLGFRNTRRGIVQWQWRRAQDSRRGAVGEFGSTLGTIFPAEYFRSNATGEFIGRE
jgi:hypothetical protein